MTKLEITQIAKSAHNVVKAFTESLGASTQPSFDELDDISKDSIVDAVEVLQEARRTYAGSVHDAWVNKMIDAGWVYGKTYDAKNKTHPDMIDYRSLPPLQRAKDKLFVAVVKLGKVATFSENKIIQDEAVREDPKSGGK